MDELIASGPPARTAPSRGGEEGRCARAPVLGPCEAVMLMLTWNFLPRRACRAVNE